MLEKIEKNGLDSPKQELDSLRLKHFKTNTPPKLFHYTDARGVLGILDSQQLWATHALYLNDTTEIRYTEELVEEIYLSLIEQAKPGDKEISDFNNPLWIYRDFLSRLSYKSLRVKPNPDYFVSCFCEKDDLLSQWRGYGNRGFGYAIGFDTKPLLNHPKNAFELRKVIYSVEEQKQIVNEILEAVIASLKRMTNTMNVDSAMFFTEAHAQIFEEEITKYSTFFKHPTFHEENEWRLICFPTRNADSNQIKYRCGCLGIIPYVEVRLPDDKNNIASIRIGPTVQPELAIKALEMLAGIKYLNLEISSSAIPLR